MNQKHHQVETYCRLYLFGCRHLACLFRQKNQWFISQKTIKDRCHLALTRVTATISLLILLYKISIVYSCLFYHCGRAQWRVCEVYAVVLPTPDASACTGRLRECQVPKSERSFRDCEHEHDVAAIIVGIVTRTTIIGSRRA
jgi:hypothetical protein